MSEIKTKTAETEDLYAQLMKDTGSRIQELEESDLMTRFDEYEQKLKGMTEEGVIDEEKIDIFVKAREATFESLEKHVSEEQDVLAKAVFGIKAIMKKFGEDFFSDLERLKPEEQKLIDDAVAEKGAANTELEEAKQKWNIFGSRDRAIDAANDKIKLADEKIKTAEETAKNMARNRLLSADLRDSLGEFTYIVERGISLLEKRIDSMSKQRLKATARKQAAFETKNKAARVLELVRAEKEQKEAELEIEAEKIEAMANGTEEHSKQTELVSELRRKTEELRNKYNETFILFQKKEEFAKFFEIDEQNMMKVISNHKMFAIALRATSEEQRVTFQNRLETMQGASDQEVASHLDETGSKINQNNAEYQAMVGAVSDRIRMEMIERHPDIMENIAKIQQAMAENEQLIRKREGKSYDDFMKMYGVDPLREFYFSHTEKEVNVSE